MGQIFNVFYIFIFASTRAEIIKICCSFFLAFLQYFSFCPCWEIIAQTCAMSWFEWLLAVCILSKFSGTLYSKVNNLVKLDEYGFITVHMMSAVFRIYGFITVYMMSVVFRISLLFLVCLLSTISYGIFDLNGFYSLCYFTGIFLQIKLSLWCQWHFKYLWSLCFPVSMMSIVP